MTKPTLFSLCAICALLAAFTCCASAQAATKVGARDMTFGHKGFVFPHDGRGYAYTGDESLGTDPRGRLLVYVQTFTERASDRELADGGFILKYDQKGKPVKSFGLRGRASR